MSTLEKEIEAKVTAHAKATGWVAYKWVSPGKAGVPDRIYFIHGHALCIEFKALGKKATALQEKRHRELRKQGIVCDVIDNVTEGKHLLDTMAAKWDLNWT
jgi:hypothetical protein